MQQKAQPATEHKTETSTIPAWLTAASQGNIGYAGSLPDYVPFTGQGVAGLTPDQMRAFDLQRGGVGDWRSIFDPAVGGATRALNFATPMVSALGVASDAEGLMNPYIRSVVDATGAEIDRNRAIELGKVGGMAGRAFGGDRHAVMEAETNRNFDALKAKTTADLMSSGYSDAVAKALGIATGNQNAAISGAGVNLAGTNALGGFADAVQRLRSGDVSGLLQTGGIQQGADQAQKTFDYQEFLRQVQSPYQKLQAMISAAGSAPHDTTKTTDSEKMTYSNPLGTYLGLGLGIAGLGGFNWVPGAANAIGSGVAGMMPQQFFSSGSGYPVR